MNIRENRLYYEQSELSKFESTVTECEKTNGGWLVELEQTAFYPTSGGQPNDVGTLGDSKVTDVMVSDGKVLHLVDKPLPVGEKVIGEIDWVRRFDHMQHHTGQHILSAVFEKLFNLDTVGFHLGDEYTTVDVGREITSAEAGEAEQQANQVVWEDRPVTSQFVRAEELDQFRLRRPPKVREDIRIVQIEDFDDNACGGTHVRSTAQVGLVKILRLEKLRGGTRVTFVCGRRAAQDYDRKLAVLTELSTSLSCGIPELVDVTLKMQSSISTLRRTEQQLWERLAGTIAEDCLQDVRNRESGERVVSAALDGVPASQLKNVLQRVMDRLGDGDRTAGLCVYDEGRVHVVIASQTSGRDAGSVIRTVLQPFGGKGGGTVSSAQGSMPAGKSELADQVASAMLDHLLS